MAKFIIEGGHPLQGTITASGNKNAALKLLPACLLTSEAVVLHNIPDIQDVRTMLLIIEDLGVTVTALAAGSWRIQADTITKTTIDPRLGSQIRASFVLSGPMLARMGEVTLPIPGGDVIGGRPLDTHMQGITALGGTIEVHEQQAFVIRAKQLKGAHILQAEASVTATENTIMTAVLAQGETIIEHAACEPHVRDLCHFLNSLGAQISGVGSNRLHIQGVNSLHGGEYTIGADFMEVGSFIGAAAMTGGEIRIERANPGDLGMVALVYERLGIRWQVDGEAIIVPAQQERVIVPAFGGRISEIKPMPWPGFPADLMSIILVMATQAQGTILLHDWMYESRFFFVDKLVFMGAHIVLCDPHRVLVQGVSPLYANPQGITSPDIRAGMAMVLAALAATGTSTISNINQIDRGYEHIEKKLQQLGAHIERVE